MKNVGLPTIACGAPAEGRTGKAGNPGAAGRREGWRP